MSLDGQRGGDGARDERDGPPGHRRTCRRDATIHASSSVAAAPAIIRVAKSALTESTASTPAASRITAGEILPCLAASACRRADGGEGRRRRVTAVPAKSRTNPRTRKPPPTT